MTSSQPNISKPKNSCRWKILTLLLRLNKVVRIFRDIILLWICFNIIFDFSTKFWTFKNNKFVPKEKHNILHYLRSVFHFILFAQFIWSDIIRLLTYYQKLVLFYFWLLQWPFQCFNFRNILQYIHNTCSILTNNFVCPIYWSVYLIYVCNACKIRL